MGLRVVFLSHSQVGDVIRVGSHHLSRELSRAGHHVVHVAAPVSLAHLPRIRDAAVKKRLAAAVSPGVIDDDGVLHLVPLTALPLTSVSPSVRRKSLRRNSRWRRELLAGWTKADIVFVDQPTLGSVAADLDARVKIYRPTDAHYDAPVRQAELEFLAEADGIVATSQKVLDEIVPAGTRLPSLVLENGVEYDRFAEAATEEDRRGAVYVGAVDRRFDWQVIVDLANANPDVPIMIAGPVTSSPASPVPPNVALLGPVPYSDIPRLLSRARVGLLPLSDDKGNEGRSPMKFYEYLAAGLNVVARTSPALEARDAPGVWLYEDAESARSSFVAAIDRPENNSGRTVAQQFGWERRSAELIDFVRGLG